MLRFIAYAVPLLILLLALFGFTVELLDAEPRSGSVIRLALFEQPRVPGQLVIGAWLVEASGLIALFLLAQGRFGAWWLDGLVAGWVAWVFRGPLLVITIVVAARQPPDPWWKLAFGWWVLYSVCGLSLAILARRSGLASWTSTGAATKVDTPEPEATLSAPEVDSTAPEEATNATQVEQEPREPVDAAPAPEASGPGEAEPVTTATEEAPAAEVVEPEDPPEPVAAESPAPGSDPPEEPAAEAAAAGSDAGKG